MPKVKAPILEDYLTAISKKISDADSSHTLSEEDPLHSFARIG